jgi:hypothetical protein
VATSPVLATDHCLVNRAIGANNSLLGAVVLREMAHD